MRQLLELFQLTLHVHNRWAWLKRFVSKESIEYYQEELEAVFGPAGDHSFITLYVEDRSLGIHETVKARKTIWMYKYADKP